MKYKLKPTPENIVVHTPTEEEAKELLEILHENGYKWSVLCKSLIKTNYWHYNKESTTYLIKRENKKVDVITEGALMFDIFTLAEFKSKYCQEKEPKLEVGDKVKIKETYYKEELHGSIGIVRSEASPFSFYVEIDNTIYLVGLNDLEPYTEPTEENKNETKEETMQTKELNLVELLKGYEGERFYCIMWGEADVVQFSLNGLRIATCADHDAYLNIDEQGKFDDEGICILYPSKELFLQYPLDPYTAWQKWQEEQKKYELFISIEAKELRNLYSFNTFLKFPTPADRDKAISEIKAVIEKKLAKYFAK